MTKEEILDREIKALTWNQPFASLMLLGKIETRTWNTNYRGLVLICSGLKYMNSRKFIEVIGDQMSRIPNILPSFVFGKAIAIGELAECRKMIESDADQCFVQFDLMLYCHIYQNVQAIKPLEWKGVQGWKTVDLEFKKRIEFL